MCRRLCGRVFIEAVLFGALVTAVPTPTVRACPQVYLALGQNYIESEEIGQGDEQLQTAQRRMHLWRGQALVPVPGEDPLPDGPVDTSEDAVLLEVYNQVAMVWSNRGEPEKAEAYLLAAEGIYTAQVAVPGLTPERAGKLEDLYCTTVFFLAQVCAGPIHTLPCPLASHTHPSP